MEFDADDRFEIKADAFYRETGQLAPGKDAATFSDADEERREAWNDWNTIYGKVIDRVLNATERYLNILSP